MQKQIISLGKQLKTNKKTKKPLKQQQQKTKKKTIY